ncbi:MAG: hypothetical protein AB1630_10330 [bacterium]
MQTEPISSNGVSQGASKPKKGNGDFLKFLNDAIGKTNKDPGWEDREEIRVLEKGINQWDVEKDGRIDAKDIKRLFPKNKRVIEEIEAYLGKTDKDPGWKNSSIRGLIRRRRWWGLRRRYYWGSRVIPGYKRYDYNHDKKIDNEDIRLLIPDAKVRDAYLKTSKDPGWEDKVLKEIIFGYKNADLNQDGIVDNRDLALYFEAEIEKMKKEAGGKPLTDLEKIQEAKKLLSEYYNFKVDNVELCGKIAKDICDIILDLHPATKEPWLVFKMIYNFARNKPKEAILELDPTWMVSIVEKSANYGSYIWNTAATNFGLVEEKYKDAIKEYLSMRSDPNATASNTEWPKPNLPGWKLIKADVDYYIEKRKHISGFNLPQWLVEAIENGVKDLYNF